MKYHYTPAVFDTPEAPEMNEGYYAVLLEEDAERQHNALRNCLLLAMRNLHVKHPDSLAAKNWEAIVRFCKEGGVEPSPLRAEMETESGPASLVGALQDKVHTDDGPFRAGRAVKETASAPADPDEETPCPKREDGLHCECWYGGNPCCGCGVSDILDGREKAPCSTANR